MKKIFISIMAVAAMFNLCACSIELNDDPEVNPDSEKAIVFDNSLTRALVNSADELLSMGVFAQRNYVAGSNDYIQILNNEKVYRATKDEAWTYDNTRYWARNSDYHFFAVWPYSEEDNSILSKVAGDDPLGYSVTFETPENADQELLTAKTSVTTKSGEKLPESVVLNFQHDLSNIHLKVWSNGAPDNVQDKIKVKQVTIRNVTKKATLNTTIDGSSWSHSSTKTGFTKTYDGDGITVSQAQIIDGKLEPNPVSEYNRYNDRPGIPFGDEGLLLIPHTITQSNPVIVEVIYDLQRPIDVEEGLWEEKRLQAFLPEGTWPAGKKLTYNLIISGERTITEFQIITFVEDWNRQPEEINFTDQVEVWETEKMQWVEGTYESLNEEKGEVVLFTDVDKVAICQFNIRTPVGATWTASLIPLTASAMDAFSIVEGSEHGVVGTDEMQQVKIKINNPDPISARNACLLRITVQTPDGRSIVVKNLMPKDTDDGIKEFTIIQNLING